MSDIKHCVAIIRKIVTLRQQDHRSILQLGYNLGRLSELTGQGRAPFWDRWKDPVSSWNMDKLVELAQELPEVIEDDH